MAEGVKLLNPEKKVILAHAEAGCPMAEQIAPVRVAQFKLDHPGVPVVAYINTTAELKSVCDVCVTSSTAVKIVSRMPEMKFSSFRIATSATTFSASCLTKKSISGSAAVTSTRL